jgi:hypothetical protein
MALLNSIASWLMVKRMHQIELFMKYPDEVQAEWFTKLIASGRETEFGSNHGFNDVHTYADFIRNVPVQSYDSLKPYIERTRQGEQHLLWPTEVKWFAKSSGTTNDKSKLIPVTEESLEDCHFRAGKDMITLYCSNYPEHQLFTGKNLALGGSHRTDEIERHETYQGDVSAIVIQNLPMWADMFRAPAVDIALMSEWNEKLQRIAETTKDENVVSLAGVPSWMIVVMRKVMELTGKSSIREVWPNLEIYFHGGVSLAPYQPQLKELLGKDINYLELYNASEGFFGIQDQKDSKDLLLMLDYGIFYEFIPQSDWNSDSPATLQLHEVTTGVPYAMLITTTGGLWRYAIGDTIEFTSRQPYRFRITGRTKSHINVFGEELMEGNAERALVIACEKTGAVISEYTAAAVFLNERKQARHEWAIEFQKEPADLQYFAEVLDNTLKTLNSDYEAKRYCNHILLPLKVHSVKEHTFQQWFRKKGKLGGQFKIPRLSNENKVLNEILALASN